MGADARSRLSASQDTAAPRSVDRPRTDTRYQEVVVSQPPEDHMGWFAFGVCLPIPGFLVWFANHNASPEKCERLIKGVIWGLVLTLVMALAMFGASSCVGTAVSRLSSSAASAIATAATERNPQLDLSENWYSVDGSSASTPPVDVSSIEGTSDTVSASGDNVFNSDEVGGE